MTILASLPAVRSKTGKIQALGYVVRISDQPTTKAQDDRFLAWVNDIAAKVQPGLTLEFKNQQVGP